MNQTSLNMNYEPEVIVDTAPLSREDWLSYRKLGIGGSGVAAIMGISPFATIRDLSGLTVFPVRKMFRHPLYPFLLADVDFFIIFPDGSYGILECKTCNYNARSKWDEGGIPDNYVLQVRHYLSVMNMDKAYIACLYGNNENEFVIQPIDRDVIEEEKIISKEDSKSSYTIFIGGGAVLLKRFLEESDRLGKYLFIEDLKANARGYDLLYRAYENGK